MSIQGTFELREVFESFDAAELLFGPAVHQRRRMSPSRQRVTRAVTRLVTLSADSMGLVVASVRLDPGGIPRP